MRCLSYIAICFAAVLLVAADKPKKEKANLDFDFYKFAHTKINRHNRDDVDAKMRELIRLGADVNAFSGSTKDTPLHAAAVYASPEMIELLLSLGADVNKKSLGGATPLHYAAQLKRLDNCQSLLKNGADAMIRTKSGETALQIVLRLRKPNLDIAKLLEQHMKGKMSLFDVAEIGDLKAVKRFIMNGSNIDESDQRGRTPLYLAARNGHSEIGSILLKAGADPNIKGKDRFDKKGYGPLVAAARHKHPAVVKLLVDRAGKKIDSQDIVKALSVTIRNRDVASFKHLLEAPVPESAKKELAQSVMLAGMSDFVDVFTDKGLVLPLWATVRLGRTDATKKLLKGGANPNEPSPDGMAPLHYAVGNENNKENTKIVKLLIDHGSKVDLMVMRSRMTPLHIAALGGNTEVIKLLISHGAKPNVWTKTFRSPLHFAVGYNHYEALKVLLDNGADPHALPDGAEKKDVESLLELAKDVRDKKILELLRKYGLKE